MNVLTMAIGESYLSLDEIYHVIRFWFGRATKYNPPPTLLTFWGHHLPSIPFTCYFCHNRELTGFVRGKLALPHREEG